MNSALKTIKNALEVLPDSVLLEVIEDKWYYDEEDSYVYWQGEDEHNGEYDAWVCSGRITEGHTEMYDLFMCNIDTETGTWATYIFLQEKRLATNPEEILHER